MNNTSTGSVRATKKIIPELRFPEFSNDGEWVEATFGSAARFINGRAYKQEELLDCGKYKVLRVGNFFTNNNWYYSDLDLEPDKYCEYGDLLYAWSASFGPRIWLGEKTIYHYHIWKVIENSGIDKNFLFKLLDNETEKMKSQNANGFALLHITKGTIENWKCNFPKNKNEQQKIASCLSSLDEVIAAHSQKLDALKTHKKGLMQNFFPQEGEKVPKVRFSEFKNDGVWVEKKLGSIGEPLMCKRILKEQTTSNPKDGIPFYKIGTFGRTADSYIPQELYNDFRSKYSFPNNGDILISAAGTIGRLVVYDGSPAYFQDSNIVWLGNDEALVLNSFLFHSYSKLKWQTSDGGIISRLYNSDLKSMKIFYPLGKIEQQKIAECLSSIDELITAQTEKIEVLKLHKKGLMQGLFPKINN